MERDGGHQIAAMIHVSYTVTGMGLRPVPGDRAEGVDRTVIIVTVLAIFPLLPRPLCNASAQLQAYAQSTFASTVKGDMGSRER